MPLRYVLYLLATNVQVRNGKAYNPHQLYPRLRTRREFVGVELYGMQQQLARLQVALEQTHADFNGLGESRARAELDADAAKRRYAELKGVGDALQKRLVKNESELNALQDTLRQVGAWGRGKNNEAVRDCR